MTVLYLVATVVMVALDLGIYSTKQIFSESENSKKSYQDGDYQESHTQVEEIENLFQELKKSEGNKNKKLFQELKNGEDASENLKISEDLFQELKKSEVGKVSENLFQELKKSGYSTEKVFSEPKKSEDIKKLFPERVILTHHRPVTPHKLMEEEGKSDFFKPLSTRVIKRVKKFLLFVGYGRSGHSIIGSILDAHPHVIVSYEFYTFRSWSKLAVADEENWKANYFNELYKKSYEDANRVRMNKEKGYNLKIDNLWQGRYDEHIDVIGDKSAGATTEDFLKNKISLLMKYTELEEKVSLPFHLIHTVRNPFDVIATTMIYRIIGIPAFGALKKKFTRHLDEAEREKLKLNYPKILEKIVEETFSYYNATMQLMSVFLSMGDKLLEVHNTDLVHYPKETIFEICEFLELECSDDYLDVCAGKIFKSTSRTRNMVVWPTKLKNMIERRIKKYDMLERYDFNSD